MFPVGVLVAIMVLSHSCLLSLTRAHASINTRATPSGRLNPFRPTSDCRQQTFSTRNIKCQPTDRSLKAQNAPQRHFWRDLSVFIIITTKSKKRTSAWLQMRFKGVLSAGLAPVLPLVICFQGQRVLSIF